jgi:hypothetical protein
MQNNSEDMCDEEKSFLNWIQKQDDLNNSWFDILKTTYMQGYAAGFHYKLKYSSDEYLQK